MTLLRVLVGILRNLSDSSSQAGSHRYVCGVHLVSLTRVYVPSPFPTH